MGGIWDGRIVGVMLEEAGRKKNNGKMVSGHGGTREVATTHCGAHTLEQNCCFYCNFPSASTS